VRASLNLTPPQNQTLKNTQQTHTQPKQPTTKPYPPKATHPKQPLTKTSPPKTPTHHQNCILALEEPISTFFFDLPPFELPDLAGFGSALRLRASSQSGLSKVRADVPKAGEGLGAQSAASEKNVLIVALPVPGLQGQVQRSSHKRDTLNTTFRLNPSPLILFFSPLSLTLISLLG